LHESLGITEKEKSKTERVVQNLSKGKIWKTETSASRISQREDLKTEKIAQDNPRKDRTPICTHPETNNNPIITSKLKLMITTKITYLTKGFPQHFLHSPSFL
jgi:hypothetical protein